MDQSVNEALARSVLAFAAEVEVQTIALLPWHLRLWPLFSRGLLIRFWRRRSASTMVLACPPRVPHTQTTCEAFCSDPVVGQSLSKAALLEQVLIRRGLRQRLLDARDFIELAAHYALWDRVVVEKSPRRRWPVCLLQLLLSLLQPIRCLPRER